MTFIEKTFAIEVGMDDLDIENFKSLNATTAFVLKKNGRRNGWSSKRLVTEVSHGFSMQHLLTDQQKSQTQGIQGICEP